MPEKRKENVKEIIPCYLNKLHQSTIRPNAVVCPSAQTFLEGYEYLENSRISCSWNTFAFNWPVRLSVNSKPDHLPGDTQGLARSHCSRVGFSSKFLCWGSRGFELEKFSTVLKEKCRNFSICFKETGGSLKSRCSCAVSYPFLQKQ